MEFRAPRKNQRQRLQPILTSHGDRTFSTPLRLDSVTIKTPTLTQNTSWYANNFPGGRAYVQQDINTLYVDPGPNVDPLTGASVNEARIYTNGYWDEGGAAGMVTSEVVPAGA